MSNKFPHKIIKLTNNEHHSRAARLSFSILEAALKLSQSRGIVG